MKKKFLLLLTITIIFSVNLSGCQESKGLETDNIKISQYKEIELEQSTDQTTITEDDVENAIQTILELQTETIVVTDRAALYGDTVSIDFSGEIDGETFDGGTGYDFPLTIGSGIFIPGFEDSIIGHNIGDSYVWSGIFPEGYSNTDYIGKYVTYTITLNSITESKKPELTDDFVKSVSNVSITIEDYKNEIKEQLQEEANENYNNKLAEDVWQIVLDNTEVISYPENEIKKICDEQTSPYKSMAESFNMEYKDFIESQIEMSVEDFEKEITDAAKLRIKQSFVANAIAEKEKITLNTETYEQQLEILVQMYGYKNVDELKAGMPEEELREIALNNLVKEWLVTHSIKKP